MPESPDFSQLLWCGDKPRRPPCSAAGFDSGAAFEARVPSRLLLDPGKGCGVGRAEGVLQGCCYGRHYFVVVFKKAHLVTLSTLVSPLLRPVG